MMNIQTQTNTQPQKVGNQSAAPSVPANPLVPGTAEEVIEVALLGYN